MKRILLPLVFVVMFVASFGVVHVIGSAHADGAEAVPVIVQAAPIPATDPIAVIGVILGALGTLGVGVLAMLRIIAPHTKNTIDDKIRDDLEILLAIWRGFTPPTSTTTTVTRTFPPDPEPEPLPPPPSAITRIGSVAVLLLAGVALSQSACATARPRLATAAGAWLDCEADALKTAWVELLGLAKPAIMYTISGAGHVDAAALKAAMREVRSDVARCAVNAAIAAVIYTPPATPGAPAAAPMIVDSEELKAAYAAAQVSLGWPVMAP